MAAVGQATRARERLMRATIDPPRDHHRRPYWSVMIPAFNCAAYLEETLQSVLAQDQGAERMQIEVVDDASSEAIEPLVERIGKGRVGYFRQASNVGQVANFATCLTRARGEIVHLLHGDDLVLDGFYAALERGFAGDRRIGAAFCRWQLIDGAGRVTAVAEPERTSAGLLDDALARLASEQRIVTPAIAVRRQAFERLGGFDARLQCAEDWEMWVRIAAHYQIWYEPRVLASYRQHRTSTTARHSADASELRYTLRAIRLFKPLLPSRRAAAIVACARRAYAATALRSAEQFCAEGNCRAMSAHLLMALRLWPRPSTIRRVARIAREWCKR